MGGTYSYHSAAEKIAAMSVQQNRSTKMNAVDIAEKAILTAVSVLVDIKTVALPFPAEKGKDFICKILSGCGDLMQAAANDQSGGILRVKCFA